MEHVTSQCTAACIALASNEATSRRVDTMNGWSNAGGGEPGGRDHDYEKGREPVMQLAASPDDGLP